jgi:protein ImuB
MTVAEARAIEPRLVDAPHEPAEDERELKIIISSLGRFSPLIGLADDRTIALDTTGCEGLFGPLPNLARLAAGAIAARGYSLRAAMAPGPTAARALAWSQPQEFAGGKTARIPLVASGAELEALAPLPPSLLNISAEAIAKCSILGIRTIEQLVYLPRGALAARLGAVALLQLDRALGRAPDPLVPVRGIELPSAEIEPLAPIEQFEMVQIAMGRMAQEVAAKLERQHLGARSIECELQRVDGRRDTLAITLSEPRRDAEWLDLLLRTRLERTTASGAGICRFSLRVTDAELLHGAQATFVDAGRSSGREEFRSLLDRLLSRLGDERVRVSALQNDIRPHRAWVWRRAPLGAAPVPEGPDAAGTRRFARRPLRMYTKPKRIELRFDGGGTSGNYLEGGRNYTFSGADGPEAICYGWWDACSESKHYWILHRTDGSRVLACQDPPNGQSLLLGEFC